MTKRHADAPPLLVLVLLLALPACRLPGDPPDAPTADTDLLRITPALTAGDRIHVVVEIPAGTNDKWEVDHDSGRLHWEVKDGKPRVVQYLAYPGNYGMIPRTVLRADRGGDGDPLDVLVLGPAIARGSVVEARPIGVLRLVDDGERDDKIIAVPLAGPLSDVRSISELDARYPGVTTIVRTWFTNYKGPGRLVSHGEEDAEAALAIIREASASFGGD